MPGRSRASGSAGSNPASASQMLRNDRLIGKLDARADRKEGVLRVNAIHPDEPFSKAASADVHREIRRLAGWLELEVVGL